MLHPGELNMLMKSEFCRDIFNAGVAQGIAQVEIEKRAFSRGFKKGLKRGFKRGYAIGHKAAIEGIVHSMLRRRFQRELTTVEQAVLSARAAGLSCDQIIHLVELDTAALRTWLFGRDAS